jgi:hypothetical protein
MRSALVALAAATSFFLSVFGLSDAGRPVPNGIEAGAAGERSTELSPLSPDVSPSPIDRFEEVEPLVQVKRIDAPDIDAPVALEPPPPGSSRSDPQPSPPPAPEPSPEPSPSPSPSPSPTPTPTPSATPSPTAEPAP